MSPIPTRRVVFTATCLFATTAGLLWLARNESPSHPATVTAADRGTMNPTTPLPEPRPARTPKKAPASAAPRLESEETWDLNIGGQPLSIVLALDEALLRDADGKESISRLSPPATQETLPARLSAMNAPGGVFPVAYLSGEERSTATRRIVTPDLRVQLDAAAAEKVARQHQLSIKDRPDYASGWVIMTAKDAFAALDAMINLREEDEIAAADVLLATRHSLRALPNDPLVTQQWHLKKTSASSANTDVNIEEAWNYGGAGGMRGTGIRIGIVDDGLQTAHPDLIANVDSVNDKDWNGNDADPNPGTDDDHGTACAGNAAARGNNGTGVSGTAPEATLVGMRLIAASVTDAQEAEAMNYLPQLVEIKSNSWGPNDTGNILEGPGPLTLAALQTATTSGRGNKGSIILWAGGNGGNVGDNSNYDGYANSIHTIAIGAVDSTGARSYYSERGSNLVVCAPSDGALGITTVDRTGANGYNSASSPGGDYTDDFGGTSSATPTAAGVVALVLQKNPNLGWRDMQEILIRSARKFRPADAGWVNNGAGIPFNHDFGAGLIDATAAVNLAATWTNLAAQTSTTVTQSGLSVSIPNNNTTGVSRTFNLASSNIRVEHVTLKLSASHTARGNLAVTLTSPTGMSSNLAEVHSDTGDNYSNWTFSSVRHWGENSTGTWTLKVADLSSTGNSNGGTLTGAELTVFGTPSTPVNPAPIALITQPAADQTFSPGAVVTVNVSASDLTMAGTPGTITQVELLDNGTPVEIDTVAPYSFTFSPSPGSHDLVARATDSEGATGTSVSVRVSVINQPPTIAAAVLSASGQSYADGPLTVSSVTASDPEGSAISYSYQWQSSINQTVYTDETGATSATAPAIPARLWRCVVTASDGNSTSQPFTTDAVNLLPRPAMTAQTGTSYSYTSGLVLRGTDSALSRQAIIHEFSQGPVGGTAEWVEILTLQDGSLAYWDLQDAGGNILVFADSAVWDDIPAGTLVVIYNGDSKDPLLPPDDLDPSDGRMVVSSTNADYFDAEYDSWLPLGNSGDAIFLSDADANGVHSVSYGNNSATTPNVGSVGSGKSAYYNGDTDAGADYGSSWKVTTALVARRSKALLPGVTLTGGSYSQDFNTTPGAAGTAYPGGWTCYNGSTSGATEDTAMSAGTAASMTGANYNYGSRIGILGSGSAFDPSSLVMALANTNGAAEMKISFDVIKIREQGRSISFKLQYSTTSATAGFTDVPGAAYLSGSIAETTVTSFTNIVLPSATWNSAGPVYLRWLYANDSGSGSRDGLALDNVAISSGTSGPSLTVAVLPSSFAENAGAAAATGTVTRSPAPASDLVITLGSSDTTEATVPTNVTLPAGQTTVTFPVNAVDDNESDGPQTVVITANTAATTITVTDNEAAIEGITPGSTNSAVNGAFVSALRNGSLNSPALFRIGTGANIPAGLVLDAVTGTLAGTILMENPAGNYPVILERFNTLGESVSQTYTLVISSGTVGDYAAWIAGFQVGGLTGPKDDPDGDGIPNALENFFGTAPDAASSGLNLVSSTNGNLVFRHTRSNTPANDVAPVYEWSTDLASWHATGTGESGTTVTLAPTVITDNTAPANDLIEVTASVSGTPKNRIFVRLKSTK